jgi:hypothetical protein
LNGIYAKGFFRWNVGFGEIEGWVAEDFISPLN